MMVRVWIGLAGMMAALSVVMGAFTAHGLKVYLSPYQLDIVKTAAYYQLIHSLALLLIAVLAINLGKRLSLSFAAFGFIIGTFLFSGSLYALAFGAPSWVGPITPIGGLFFIFGWLALSVSMCRTSHF